MEAGNVVAMFLEETRFSSREEWERACAGVWDDALAELRTNPGFRGLAAFWADDDTARGGVMGLWDSLEHRLRYEARSAGKVRALFDPFLTRGPRRPRLHVTNATME